MAVSIANDTDLEPFDRAAVSSLLPVGSYTTSEVNSKCWVLHDAQSTKKKICRQNGEALMYTLQRPRMMEKTVEGDDWGASSDGRRE